MLTENLEVDKALPLDSREDRMGIRHRITRKSQELIYEFTRQEDYLFQYYQLREQMFTRVWGLKNFPAAPDEFDKNSHILIARRGRQVVGGARITVSSPRRPMPLPMECEDFSIVASLPDLQLEHKKYAEMTRFAILPDFADGRDVAKEMIKQVNRKVVALNIHYIFAIAPLLQTRSTQINCKMLDIGFKLLSMVDLVEKEEYEGIKMHLHMMWDKDIVSVEEVAEVFSMA